MKHFTLLERELLAEMLETGRTYREIRKVIGKSLSSISDEVHRNKYHKGDDYDAAVAHRLSKQRQKQSHRRRSKLELDQKLRDHVLRKLEEDHSPEQITGELRELAHGRCVISHETIYQFIYSSEGKQLELWKHLRHRKKPQRISWGKRKKRSQTLIPKRTPISARPRFIDQREVFGHYEGDLMQFSSCGKTLAVFVERKSRRVCIVVNNDKSSHEMELAIHECISTVGQCNFHSLSLDNGTENVIHESVREQYCYSFDTFFCDPYCSWQKGSVENMNKLIRQYFPRDINPQDITQDFADEVSAKLNNRPRKCLHYQTPLKVFSSCSV